MRGALWCTGSRGIILSDLEDELKRRIDVPSELRRQIAAASGERSTATLNAITTTRSSHSNSDVVDEALFAFKLTTLRALRQPHSEWFERETSDLSGGSSYADVLLPAQLLIQISVRLPSNQSRETPRLRWDQAASLS